MIASFVDGRVRIRREELKNPDTMNLVIDMIRAQDGILELVPNTRTGSLLILYDPEKISRAALMEAAETLEKQFGPIRGEAAPKKRVCGKMLTPLAETGLLSGIYGLTLLSCFASRRLHVLCGLAFTGLAVMHVYTRRRML